MIQVFKEKINNLKLSLNESQLNSIHFQSVNNFLKYFCSIKNEAIQQKIITYLNGYFREIEEKQYDLVQSDSNEIYQKYIMQIGTLYNAELDFKIYIRPKVALFFGVHVDLLLLIFGLLKRVYYIPVITVLLTGYFLYIHVFYKARGKIYGSRI